RRNIPRPRRIFAVEPENQTEELYDYLYRDSNRVASLYAQIFGGKLSHFERSDATRDASDTAGKATLAIVRLEGKTTKESSAGIKRTFDASYILISDVLAPITAASRFNKDIAAAPHGALIIARGTLTFIDKSMMGMTAQVYDLMLESAKKVQGKA